MSRRPNFDDYVEPEPFADWCAEWRQAKLARERRMNGLLAFLTVIGMAVGLWVVIGLIGWALLM